MEFDKLLLDLSFCTHITKKKLTNDWVETSLCKYDWSHRAYGNNIYRTPQTETAGKGESLYYSSVQLSFYTYYISPIEKGLL